MIAVVNKTADLKASVFPQGGTGMQLFCQDNETGMDSAAEQAASLAVRALLYEVCTTPKPGLVDRNNNGSHRDMDIFTFMRSSASLWPYFARCFNTGVSSSGRPAPGTFASLRPLGIQAEAKMFRATRGINTHKGAIFTIGLACAALGRLCGMPQQDRDAISGDPAARILSEISAMTEGTVSKELEGLTKETARTAGQRFYLEYGVTGIRGQAEAGFPTVLKFGLPALEQGLSSGKSPDEAGCAAMLQILARTTDTNMISRGGRETQMKKAAGLLRLLEKTPQAPPRIRYNASISSARRTSSASRSYCCSLYAFRESTETSPACIPFRRHSHCASFSVISPLSNSPCR